MTDLINISKGFQTSINIAYDLNDDDKVQAFIPTMSSLDIIEDVLLSTVASSTQRARILIGAYGRGKSHIILVLLSLLHKKNMTLFNTLLGKMREHSPSLHDFTANYLNSEQRLLPIVIRGSSTSLTQSFLHAIQQTLNESGLSDLMPETHFRAAVNQIDSWRDRYPDTYEKFSKALSKPVSDFKLSLNEFSISAYEEFTQLYPELTSGSLFNPFLGFDIVELYENVTAKLKDKGFDGIYVVYDEFSKYLESSINTATNSDIKLLQDFAEKCDRSGDTQMHLMLISHKDIANYIDNNLPKDKVDGWRGVSGRFKHVSLRNNFSQMYEIISAVLKKNTELWNPFYSTNLHRFNDLRDRFLENGLIEHDDNDKNTAIEGCYPLHPIATFILPRLSEKVAQNERTLFTFLSSNDKYTMSAFIQDSHYEFPLLTPDYIYDYFEPLFLKEPYTSEVHKMYKLTASVLRKVEERSLHSKILKTIALIYLVEQFEKLAPVIDVIVDAFRYSVDDPKEIEYALKELIDKECVIYLKRSNNYLKIKETSGVDIQDEILRYKEQRLAGKNITAILNESVFDSFMYPTAYNDDFNIIRYFDFKFIDSLDFFAVTNWNSYISNSKADGSIFAIIPKNKTDINRIRQAITEDVAPHQRIVFILPKQYTDITKDALDFAAVTFLKNEAALKDDEVLYDEYSIYVDDLSEVVGRYINSYAQPENGNAIYFYNGEQRNIKRRAHLTGLLSEICRDVFTRTPIINNESINKNELTSVAINSRTKIIAGLLSNELAPNIGLSGTGQDVSIMRSTLLQTGVIENIDTNPVINLEPPDEDMRGLLAEINTFFVERAAQRGGISFQHLYDTLTLHENGFGMKLGVIPIYIALVLHLCKKNLVILYRGSEVKITAELLNDINENPQDYSVILEDWNEEKACYMAQLENIFSEYVTEREKAYNSFTYLLLAMNRWYLSLPKYAKEMSVVYKASGDTQNINNSKRKFINSLKQMNINPREFLFETVFDIFNINGFSINIIPIIRETKEDYDAAVKCLISELAIAVRNMFSNGIVKGSLTSAIKDWYEALDEKSRQYLYTGNESKILNTIANVTNDENAFIQRLAKSVTFLRIDDWNNDTVCVFLRDLLTFKKTVEDYNNANSDKIDINASYEIIITNSDGTKIPRRFDKAEYSERARLLLNEMAAHLDEYGESISEQEKRQVLIELLESLC